jgi:hypothetical protein
MMDLPCEECERLWQAYDSAALFSLIVEQRSAVETGLTRIARKTSHRCEEARKAAEHHEATHMTATAVASGKALGCRHTMYNVMYARQDS